MTLRTISKDFCLRSRFVCISCMFGISKFYKKKKSRKRYLKPIPERDLIVK